MYNTYLAVVFVQTIYSTSSVYGFRKAKADVRSQTHSRFFARNLYITDITCPFNFKTEKNILLLSSNIMDTKNTFNYFNF